ncbi:DUF4920 domain-containing protein [Algoriphagus namhaensis]
MKKTLYTLAMMAAFAWTSCESKSSDEATAEITETSQEVIPGQYGAEFAEGEVMTPAQLVSKLEGTDSYTGQIMGEIKEVCTKKGCWLTMDLPNGESMRVTFKDYGFFVPATSQGFPILLEGVATRVETDVETLRHFAEDQGKSAEEVAEITEPKVEITFEATGVIIKDKA